MPTVREKHQQNIAERGELRPSEVARLRAELDGLKARSAEIESKLDIVPAWKPGIRVEVDERYSYQGVTYTVVQAHTTQVGWEPPAVPALFAPA